VSRILVAYATVDGQTERIAGRIAAVLANQGHAVTLRSFDAPDVCSAIADHDAVMIGASVRYGHHSRALESLVRERLPGIGRLPSAFFSVCLSAGGPGAKPAAAASYIEELRRRTGWDPDRTASFAGALRYRRYNPFIRFMMRLIVGAAGGDTDTSRDYEYTDWDAVDRFAHEFAARFAVQRAA